MHPNATRAALDYGMAFLAVAAAVTVRWLLDPWLGDSLALVTLYGAVAIAVWFGGVRPAIVATVLGYLACAYFFIEPRGSFSMVNPRDVVGLAAHLVTCSIIITLGAAMQIARRRAEASQKDLASKHTQLQKEVATRRQAEEELGASERWFKALARHAPAGIFQTDADGNCVFVNERWCAMAGLSPEEARGQGWSGALHPDDRDRVFREWYDAAKAGGEFASEYRFQTPQGRVTWLSGRATALGDDAGRISGYIGTVIDITEQKKAAEQMRRRAEENEKLMDLLPLGVFIAHDPECRRITGNRAGYELLRLPIGSNLSVTPAPGEQPPFIACRDGRQLSSDELPMQHAAAHAVEVRDVEVEHVYPDGTTYTLFGSASPLFDAQGEVRGCVGSFLDITERKRAEEALRQNERALRDADRRKNEFLATLAHELRNPLAPLRNSLELLRRAETRPELRARAHDMMERQLGVMVRLIDDLLNVSRITQGKLQLRLERVELAAVVAHAVEAARQLIDVQGHELTILLPSQPIHLSADPTRLSQVFLNLLTNAAKYTEKGGHIWLTATLEDCKEDDTVTGWQGDKATGTALRPVTVSPCHPVTVSSSHRVEVSVRDTGIGIAAEHLPHLFTMFSQVASALDRSEGGLGIGLSLVRGLVELHGGSVEARSDGPGLGSEFIVRLPVAEAPVNASLPSSSNGKIHHDEQRRQILVVDDNVDAADSLAEMLQMAGHTVRIAHDGLEAVQAAAIFHPEVVFCDIGLPKMNGYDAARHIREQPWGTNMVLIAITGWGQDEDKSRSLAAGFDYHLTKPVEPAAVEELLASLNVPVSCGEAGS